MRNFEGNVTTSATCSYSAGAFNVLAFIISNKSGASATINVTQNFANGDHINVTPFNYTLSEGQSYQETQRQINLSTGDSFTISVVGSAESVDYIFATDSKKRLHPDFNGRSEC